MRLFDKVIMFFMGILLKNVKYSFEEKRSKVTEEKGVVRPKRKRGRMK